MIEVNYHRKHHAVEVTGHACCGESGHDLVCAGVSALVLTLAQNVASLVTQKNVYSHTVCVKEGSAEIRCTPNARMRAVVSLIYDSICSGFDVMQTLYPENIRVHIYE